MEFKRVFVLKIKQIQQKLHQYINKKCVFVFPLKFFTQFESLAHILKNKSIKSMV